MFLIPSGLVHLSEVRSRCVAQAGLAPTELLSALSCLISLACQGSADLNIRLHAGLFS